jgi:hypothetical protein
MTELEERLRTGRFPVLDTVIDFRSEGYIGNTLVHKMLTDKTSGLWILYGEAGMGKSRLFKEWKDRLILMQQELGVTRPVRFHNMATILDMARRDIPWLKRPFKDEEEVLTFSNYLNTTISPIKSGEVSLLEIPHGRADYTLIDAAHGVIDRYHRKANIVGVIGAPTIQDREIENRQRNRVSDPLTDLGIAFQGNVARDLVFPRGSSASGLDPSEIVTKRQEIFEAGLRILGDNLEWDLDAIELPEIFGPLSPEHALHTKLRIIEMSETLSRSRVGDQYAYIILNPDVALQKPT